MIFVTAKLSDGVVYKECKSWSVLIKQLEEWTNVHTMCEVHITENFNDHLNKIGEWLGK